MASEWTLFVFQLEWAEAGRMENVTAKEILSLTGKERAKAKEKVCYILTWIFYSQAETLIMKSKAKMQIKSYTIRIVA